MDIGAILYGASVWVLPVLLAVTLHEAAHGYVALRFGDDTALRAGRITLNPFRHVDPIGTVLVPLAMFVATGGRFLFGFAKPVPVNFARLRNPRRDMVAVAAAGPGANLAMAYVAALLLHAAEAFPPGASDWVVQNLNNAVFVNLLLAVFNMLPVPPLDGGRVAVGLLPDLAARPLARIEPVGVFVVLGALFLLPYVGIDLFRWVLAPAVDGLLAVLAVLTGHG